MRKLTLLVTPGEPAGIGPDIMCQAAMQPLPRAVVAVANEELLRRRAAMLQLPLKIESYDKLRHQAHRPGCLPVINQPLVGVETIGIPKVEQVGYVLECLNFSIAASMRGDFHGTVTGPVQKAIIMSSGIHFPGHTEYFAQRTHADSVVMMLASPRMRVALHTTHIPLAQVMNAITPERLNKTLTTLVHSLYDMYQIKKPRIHVCGVNPHAGEGGHLGEEDEQVIAKVIAEWRQRGEDIRGPVSADTAFHPKHLVGVDAILAMYHDQGLPAIKAQDFGDTVNVTLGLPMIRTSVDHGVALDLAGRGKASCQSLVTAIRHADMLNV